MTGSDHRRGNAAAPGPAGQGDAALAQAVSALNNRRPNDAERIAGAMLKSDPSHVGALNILGHALLAQGRPLDAIAALEPPARSQRDPQINTLLGAALRQAGRHEEALSRLKRVAKQRPPFGPALLELGSLLMAMERDDEAIEALSRGVEAAPMMLDMSLQLGFALLRSRNTEKAKTAFARALGLSPHSPTALFGMAKAHQETGENRQAAEYFRKCLMSRPNDAATWLSLGHCLLELGELDAGFECFRTVARNDRQRYGEALSSLVKSARGRFWLKPSAAAKFLSHPKI
jgi:tetratricopeptide (TPR) repeat protein